MLETKATGPSAHPSSKTSLTTASCNTMQRIWGLQPMLSQQQTHDLPARGCFHTQQLRYAQSYLSCSWLQCRWCQYNRAHSPPRARLSTQGFARLESEAICDGSRGNTGCFPHCTVLSRRAHRCLVSQKQSPHSCSRIPALSYTDLVSDEHG